MDLTNLAILKKIADLEKRIEALEPSPNLFTLGSEDLDSLPGISFDVKTGTLDYGTDTYYTQFPRTIGEMFPDLVVGKTYTLSANMSGGYEGCYDCEMSFGNYGVNIGGNGYHSVTFTYTEGMLDGFLQFEPFAYEDEFTAWTAQPTIFGNIMLNEGDTALPFEPYDR